MFKIKNIITRFLVFYNLIAILNLLYLFVNSFNKAIIYEDSFVLLKPPDLNLISWLLLTNNGHLMVLSKLLSYVLTNLNLYPTSFFISFGILIILIALYFLWKLVDFISENQNNNKIIFLICSYFWISPWHWENLIWEFQFPWFLVSSLVIISTLIFIKKKSTDFKFLEKLFLFVSPLIAITSTGVGICYVNCLILNYYIRERNKSFPFLGIFFSYCLFIFIRITTENNNIFNFDIFTNFKYISVMVATIFKAPISANNSSSYIQWVIPIFSSLFIQLFLIININWKNFFKYISLTQKFALLNPIIFSLQFAIITSLTRSNYGIHQGAVSRYLTCLVLLPIGLIIIFYYTNNNNQEISIKKQITLKDQSYFLSKVNSFYLVIIICLLINTTSFLKTIYETHLSLNIRSENFEIFKESCLQKSNPNKEIILEEHFYKLRNYLTTNIPPFPDTKNPDIYQNYINSELCDLTNTYF